jgi:hypothetical protein
MRAVPRKISILGLLLLYGCSNDSSPSSSPAQKPAQKPAESAGNATAGAVKETPQISLDPFAQLELDEDTSKLIPLQIGTPTVGSVRIELMDPPKHGIATVNASTMTVGYSPMPDWHGVDSLSVRVVDGTSASIARTVPIVVKPIDDAPKCLSQTFGAKTATAISSTIVCTDVDGDSISIRTSTPPARGTFLTPPAGSDHYFVYNLAPNQTAADQFQVIATANGKDSAPAIITIDPASMGDKPVVVSKNETCTEDTICSVQLTASNSFQGQVFAYAIIPSVPANPKVKAEVDPTTGRVTITPEPNYSGSYSFTYTARAGQVSDPATINVTIAAVNDLPTIKLGATAPALSGGSYAVVEDNSLAFDYVISDVEKAESDLVVSLVGTALPKNGSVNLDLVNKRFTYAPKENYNGSDEFQVQVCEKGSNPAVCSVPLVMKMNATAVNDAPYANDFNWVDIQEDSVRNCTNLANHAGDVDAADQGKLVFSVLTGNEWMTLQTSEYCMAPARDYKGTYTKLYRVQDPQGQMVTRTITITVDNVDDPTIFTPSSLICAATEETKTTCKVIATDVDGQLTYAFTDANGIKLTDLPNGWGKPDSGTVAYEQTTGVSTWSVSVNPPLNFVGEQKLFVTTSNMGKVETRELKINVTNVYDKPEFKLSPAGTNVLSWTDITVVYKAESPDGLGLKYELSTADCGSNVLTVAPQSIDASGNATFKFTCSIPKSSTVINYTVKASDNTGFVTWTATVKK